MAHLIAFTRARDPAGGWKDGLRAQPGPEPDPPAPDTSAGAEARRFYESLLRDTPPAAATTSAPPSPPHRAPPRPPPRRAPLPAAARERQGHAVLRAAQEGDVAALRRLLEREGGDPAFRDAFAWTPLMCAARAGRGPAVRYLLARGAPGRREAERLARGAGHRGVARVLREWGATGGEEEEERKGEEEEDKEKKEEEEEEDGMKAKESKGKEDKKKHKEEKKVKEDDEEEMKAKENKEEEEEDKMKAKDKNKEQKKDKDDEEEMKAKEKEGTKAKQPRRDPGLKDDAEGPRSGEGKAQEGAESFCPSCGCHFRDPPGRHRASTAHLLARGGPPPEPPPPFHIPPSNVGFRLLLRGGWDGRGGLGPAGEGVTAPPKTLLKRDQRGLGCPGGPRPRVTHFGPRDPRAVAGGGPKKAPGGGKKKTGGRSEEAERAWERRLRAYMAR